MRARRAVAPASPRVLLTVYLTESTAAQDTRFAAIAEVARAKAVELRSR